jgi:hypothetical protein
MLFPCLMLASSIMSTTVHGTIRWSSPLPQLTKLEAALPSPLGDNPYDPRSSEFVVSLVGVARTSERQWPHPKVHVEVAHERIAILQGERIGRVGLIPTGASVEIHRKGDALMQLRASGAAFWTLTLPDTVPSRSRKFDTPGVVRLSSGSGQFWQAADLIVCSHSDYAVTNAAGTFQFPDVPAGEYELVVWVPSWHERSRDRNPETGMISRIHWAAPMEYRRKITVPTTGTSSLEWVLPLPKSASQ